MKFSSSVARSSVCSGSPSEARVTNSPSMTPKRRSTFRRPEEVSRWIVRRDVAAAAHLGADHDLALTARLLDEQPAAGDADVDTAPVGVPGVHPVDHLPALLRIVHPEHLRPGQAERRAAARVDVDDDVGAREQLPASGSRRAARPPSPSASPGRSGSCWRPTASSA